jgi:hypothetical protein
VLFLPLILKVTEDNYFETFEMTTFIRIWIWKLSIASSESMLKVTNNDYIGTST